MTNELIQQVKKINRQAALFMVKKVPLLVQRGKLHSAWDDEKHLCRLPSEDSLPVTFVFAETPQGFSYWNEISNELPDPYGW